MIGAILAYSWWLRRRAVPLRRTQRGTSGESADRWAAPDDAKAKVGDNNGVPIEPLDCQGDLIAA